MVKQYVKPMLSGIDTCMDQMSAGLTRDRKIFDERIAVQCHHHGEHLELSCDARYQASKA